MTEKDTEVAEMLWMELQKERAHLDAECTEDEVEQEAAWWQEAMSCVLDAMATKCRICARSQRWQNTDIEERRMTVGREKRSKRNTEEATCEKAELLMLIPQSKSQM